MKMLPLIFFSTAFICGLTGCSEQANANKTDAAAPPYNMKEVSQEEHLAKLQIKADSGNAEAQFNLGQIFMHGEGYTGVTYLRDVPKDNDRAHDLYQKAAIQGHSDAQFNFGMLYKLGLGVNANAETAFLWLQKAAAQGNSNAQYHIGMMYDEGAGTKPNLSRSSAWLALAASQGNEKAKRHYIELDAKLTPEQRAEGQQLAAGWKKGSVI